VRRAAVSVTFDNLGEASDLERGWWPEDEPLGQHYSVTRALPRVLEALDEADLRATFFVESINTRLYPETLHELDAAGHEVACHGWRHERWGGLDAQTERHLLWQCVESMRECGLLASGFRPPGGELTPDTARLLAQLGFTYCSPAEEAAAGAGTLPALPFRWPLLDAFHYLPHFDSMRERVLGSPAALAPARLRETALAALEDAARDGGFLALLFHPFLADTDERVQVIRDVLARVRALVDAGAIRCAPCRELVG
jgi:peptidoglycan/xylan/chitin deacetylase (PgdA/CDA1 family)